MPIIGLLLGQAVAGHLGHIAKYVGSAILIVVGAYTIVQGRRVPSEPRAPVRLRTHRLLVMALALSIDNLAVGFALAVYQINIVLAAATMGVISVALSLLGLELGSRLGSRVEAWSEELGGAVLIVVGLAIAVGLLG
jgi:putative Mn2+ efflux pump MntP